VQVPELLIDTILIFIPDLGYRTHHEFIMEAIRRHVGDAIDTISKLDKLKASKSLKKKLKEIALD